MNIFTSLTKKLEEFKVKKSAQLRIGGTNEDFAVVGKNSISNVHVDQCVCTNQVNGSYLFTKLPHTNSCYIPTALHISYNDQ